MRRRSLLLLTSILAPDGAKQQGLCPSALARGPRPEPLALASNKVRVAAIRHRGDSYFITTADGITRSFWEMNVRLKLDTRDTGPAPGEPVVVQAGTRGDRVSVIFPSVEELKRFIEEEG